MGLKRQVKSFLNRFKAIYSFIKFKLSDCHLTSPPSPLSMNGEGESALPDTQILKTCDWLGIFFFIIVALPCFTSIPSHGEMFFWTDRHGTPHFSNVAPSPDAEDVMVYEESNKRYQAFSDDEKHRLTFKAVKIYDGDSLKVAGNDLVLMVRLVGIDAPESGRKGVPGQPYSKKAKAALVGMIGDGLFHLKSYGTGSYNRLLSEIFTPDGRNVNLEMVKLGLVEVYQGSPPKGFDKAPYLAAESTAKSRRLGIWRLGRDYQSPKQWRKSHPRK